MTAPIQSLIERAQGRVHLLTSSRLRAAQECPRRHLYRYEMCRTPHETSRASSFGTAIHAGLEAWWIAHREGAPQYALASALHAAEGALVSDDDYASAMLRALLHAYDARWSQWAETVEVIGVEVSFEAPLRHPVTGQVARTWRVAGKIDALARLSDGRVAIIEHKTTSMDASAGSDYRRKLTLDPQVSTYFDGVEALGLRADLCLYDVLRKPAIKPLLATPEEDRVYSMPKSRACRECARKRDATPAPHFDAEAGVSCVDGRIVTDVGGRLRANQRDRDETAVEYEARLLGVIASDPDKHLLHAEIVRSDEEREAHAWALWHAVRQIEDTRRAYRESGCDPRAVPQNPGACMVRGRCDYLDVCEGSASVTDDARFMALESAHPELQTT